jgi:hypothetical protein
LPVVFLKTKCTFVMVKTANTLHMKKILTSLFFFVIAASFYAQPVGWTYVMPITITNNTATQVVNYQAQLSINTQALIGASQMQSAGQDMRFGKECSGTTLFNYWIESGINTTNTVVWVKLDTLPASGSRTFYMYFGNSSAAAVSAVPGTFFGPHSSTDSVSTGGAGGVGNSQRGFRFAPNEDILVTHFGKREPTGTTRYVTLFNFTTQAVITQQQVSGAAAQYNYGSLSNPIWLTSGTQYVLELFQGAGDGYYFGTSSQIGQHLTYYDMRYCNSCTQNTFPTSILNNYQYGYPDLWYFTKNSVTQPPTISYGSSLTLTTTSSGAVCAGDSASISAVASGGTPGYTYSWSPATGLSSTTISNPNASPVVTTIYTCNVTDQCGAVMTSFVTVDINQLPTVTATASTDSVCTGGQVTLNGGGAISYSWSGSVSDGVAFTPVSTDTYTVTGTDSSGCTNTATQLVEVLSLPTVVANSTAIAVCDGQNVTFTGSGANSYSWSGSVVDGVPFTPTSTDSYTVTGTDLYGCVNTDSIDVTVNANPVVTGSSTTAAVCFGDSVILTGSGALTYVWDNSVTDGVAFAPSATMNYVVMGTDSNGCSGSDTLTVTVNQLPNLIVTATNDSLCPGDSTTMNISGATNYIWNPSVTVGQPFVPVATTTYSVTGTDSLGCSSSATQTIHVFDPTNVSVISPANVCVNDGAYSLTGTPSGGAFSGPGVTGSSFNPTTAGVGTHTITYTFTDANGCTYSNTSQTTVGPCVGIATTESVSGMNVYPNPTQDIFYLETNLTGITAAVVTNSLGQVVLSKQISGNRTEFDLAAFDNGIYILTINTASGSHQVKIVKSN